MLLHNKIIHIRCRNNSDSYDKIQQKIENLERRNEDKYKITIDEIEVDGEKTPIRERY